MQVFEFHFNPPPRRPQTKSIRLGRYNFRKTTQRRDKNTPLKQTGLNNDIVFNSFCYEPENIYEKKMGSFYMVGLLKRALPINVRFIEKLAKTIKDKYYRSTILTPEKSLKESLKAANDFLEKIIKRGDVSWLGNLSFAALSFKNFKLNFAKTGKIKILVLRDQKIIDIDKKVTLQEIEPYPLKIFTNTVSGKLAQGDVVLVFTKDLFDFFDKQKMLDEIAKLPSFNDINFKKLLNKKEIKLSKVSGVFLAILLTKKIVLKKKSTISTKELKDFSFKKVLAPILTLLKKVKKPKLSLPPINIKLKPPKIKPLDKTASLLSSKVSKIKVNLIKVKEKTINKKIDIASLQKKAKIVQAPKIKRISLILKIKAFFFNKKMALILALIALLIFGSLFSKFEEKKEIRTYERNLKDIEEKLIRVESFLILKETNPEAFAMANLLLKETWDEISLLSKKTIGLSETFNNQVTLLKNNIFKKLSESNAVEDINSPELFFEFDKKTFIPYSLLFFEDNIYFFNRYSKNILKLKENKETIMIETEQAISLASVVNNSIYFFSRPSKLFLLNTERTEVNRAISLGEPYPDFSFNNISSFEKNVYFLDKKAGQIIKYIFSKNSTWNNSQLWLDPKIPRISSAKSFTVDGSVWVLAENLIYEYHGGEFKSEIEFEVFPAPKNLSKIFTSPSLPYFYLLEPDQKRFLVLDKSGKLIKQLQSESFDNLLDFSITEDGKTLYLLNGLKVYKVEI
jgi:hypothetical protein